MEECLDAARSLASVLVGRNWETTEVIRYLSELGALPLARRFPSAWCALELSVLDLLGRSVGQPLWSLFSSHLNPAKLTYSAVIPSLEGPELTAILNKVKEMNMQFVKVKVENCCAGEERLRQVRAMLGEHVDIRVDANGAFTWKEAIEFLDRTRRYNISAIEQPVPKTDLEGLKKVAHSQGVPVIADESICNLDDAKKIVEQGACQGFNIRLSKCGGMINAIKLTDFARKNKIFCQIGCHVGETSVLSAAGRHLAVLAPEYVYLEGSYSNILLSEDLSRPPVCFEMKGTALPLYGPGLGIDLLDASLERLGERLHSETVM